MRKLWISLLLLSISFISITAPMYAEGYVGVANKKTTTNMTTAETTTSTSSTGTTEPTYGFIIKVDPPLHKIQHSKNGKTRTATYSVSVKALSGFRGEVELTMQGLPQNSQALFNPKQGIPKPTFTSVLKILVPPSTQAGVHTLTIIASSGRTSRSAITTLIIEGEAVPPTAQQNQLTVSVSTDQGNYQVGGNVSVSGYVELTSGISVANATVSLNVLDPAGKAVHVAVTQTNQAGRFSENFTLPSSAVPGTYTVYATASMTAYKDSYATVTFTVGLSGVPSVRIVNATITMVNGTVSSEFRPGDTVVVWAVANNTGADLIDGNMWVEVLDPDKSPITIVVVVVTIHTGEQVKIGIHVILASSTKLGTYAVRILVSDGPIMTGGKFLCSKEMAFIVASESITTTTTQATTQTTSTSTSQTTSATTISVTISTTTSTSTSVTTSTTASASTSTSETTSTSTTQTA